MQIASRRPRGLTWIRIALILFAVGAILIVGAAVRAPDDRFPAYLGPGLKDCTEIPSLC